jgi:hypothetical protein
MKQVNAPQLSMHNRAAVEAATVCGCYSCLALFSPKEVQEWTDWGKTALCPKCGIDAVLPEGCGLSLTPEWLRELKLHWFGEPKVVE